MVFSSCNSDFNRVSWPSDLAKTEVHNGVLENHLSPQLLRFIYFVHLIAPHFWGIYSLENIFLLVFTILQGRAKMSKTPFSQRKMYFHMYLYFQNIIFQ